MGNAVAARRAAQPPVTGQALRILKDEKLAAMVAAGSDEAFAVLYRRHHQAIYRYSLSLLRQEADARDALQSTMLAALSSLRSRPIEGSLKPWLFRIAHNHSISIIRARAREAPTEAPAPAAVSDDPDTREQLRTLVSDLGALPDRQRGAIVMRELNGLSYAEIAAALDTSEAGGKQLVYEARSALHDLRAGHEMSCELVRERISADDRRLLRGRMVRSHLRGCEPCRDFEQAIRRRRTAFAALAPPLAPLAAAGVLQDVFGGGAGGTGGAAGVGAGATGAGGFSAAGLPALKLVAGAVLAGGAGLGAYAAGDALLSNDATSAPASVVEEIGSVAPPDRDAAPGNPGRGDGRGPADVANDRAGAGLESRGAGGADGASAAGPGEEAVPVAGDPPPVPAAGSTAPDSVGDGSGGGAGGEVPQGPATTPPSESPPPSSSNPPEPPPPDPMPEPPPPGGGGSGVPPGTPPGHGGTPPGHGGLPPGHAPGEVPPGHLP